ncbi:MAG: DUF1987 domain-containing protein [Bacteroidia bacterium]|nr:DUF1987 domain-containing protein [Bacteroidia bacterium]
MKIVKIPETDDTPGVMLDKDKDILFITGRSLPEDVNAFFSPILEWLDEYSKEPLEKTNFDFKFFYFNTASSKAILDILLKLENMYQNGYDIMVRWHYPDDDEDMKEAGEEYADIVDIPFQHISYKME